MAYDYTTYSAALAELMVTTPTQADFVAIRPSIIDYAEQRMYRELDLLNTVIRDASAVFSASNRNFTLPTGQGTFIVINGINAITPAGSAPDAGTRVPLTPTTRDVLDRIWPSVTGAGVPNEFAMITQGTIVVGPWPDAAYTVEVIGTQRPAPLTSVNTSTFLTTNLPDLFMAASMVFASGFMRNFGSQADDPKMAMSWETQYKTLFASANVEEYRKKYQSAGWSSQSPAPLASPRT